jgi:hypothetical protein
MIKMLNVSNFIMSLGGIGPCTLTLSPYVSNKYECACGQTHIFDYASEIICQGAWKLVVGCPSKKYVTCLKLKTKFLGMGFSGFESISGVEFNHDPVHEESGVVLRYIIKKHIGVM